MKASSIGLMTWTASMMISAATALAQVTITPNVSLSSGVYHYSYQVSNGTPSDLVIVSILVPAQPQLIQNLVAPVGFQANFDSGLGFLDFIEGTQSFPASGVVGGFEFDSPFAPAPTTFSALDVNGSELVGQTVAPVPEPATLAGACTLIAAWAARRSRRSNHMRHSRLKVRQL